MDTLLVFSIVFAPFVWYIWRMLRFTKDTIGGNSPLKVSRTFVTTPWNYFLQFEGLFTYYFILVGSFFFKLALFMHISYTEDHPLLVRLWFLAVGLVAMGFGLFVVALDINHWQYVEGLVIETFPEEHELELTFTDKVLRLREGDIEKVRVYHNNSIKFPLAYMHYFLRTGDEFIISPKTEGYWVIDQYFPNLPTEYTHRRFPFIR